MTQHDGFAAFFQEQNCELILIQSIVLLDICFLIDLMNELPQEELLNNLKIMLENMGLVKKLFILIPFDTVMQKTFLKNTAILLYLLI